MNGEHEIDYGKRKEKTRYAKRLNLYRLRRERLLPLPIVPKSSRKKVVIASEAKQSINIDDMDRLLRRYAPRNDTKTVKNASTRPASYVSFWVILVLTFRILTE